MRPFGRLFPDKRVFGCEGYHRSSATALRGALFDPVMVTRPQGRARLMPGRMILQVRLPAIPDLPEKCALSIPTFQACRWIGLPPRHFHVKGERKSVRGVPPG
jgi:hypothetical protein